MKKQVAIPVMVLLATLVSGPSRGETPTGEAAPAAAASTATAEPADFREFVEEARQLGMSDAAYQNLSVVAGALAQTDVIQPVKTEDGAYGMNFISSYCPKPGADPAEVQKLMAEGSAKLKAQLPKVRKWADLDGSGFVSKKEASQTRDLYEFGLQVAFAVEQEKTRDAAKIAQALRIPLPNFQQSYQAYSEMRSRYGEDFGPVLSLDFPRSTT